MLKIVFSCEGVSVFSKALELYPFAITVMSLVGKSSFNWFLKKGDAVISLASMPANEKGMTNMIKLSIVK